MVNLFSAYNFSLNTVLEATLVSNTVAEVNFTVGGSFDRLSNSNSIAITRWLLKQWEVCKEHLQREAVTPICFPYHTDGDGFYRYKIYRRLGFNPVYGVGLVYGDPIGLEVEEDIPPRPWVGDYAEWSSYDEDEGVWSGVIYSDTQEGEWEYSPKFIDDDNWDGYIIKWKPIPIDWEYWEGVAKDYPEGSLSHEDEEKSGEVLACIFLDYVETGPTGQQRIVHRRLGYHRY